MKRLAILPVALMLAASMTACGNREEVRDEVLGALHRTQQLPYRFTYIDDRTENVLPGGTPVLPDAEVQGLVEDDFRFKARVSLNGSTAFDEVVRDDLLAVRFLDPGRLGVLVNKQKVSEENTKTELENVDSLQVLESRRWVVDETAAPIVTVGRVREDALGRDPVIDAITAFTYIEEAIRSAQAVQKYSPDDVTPAYSATEDTFPKPVDGSGVTRYDLRRPKLPPPGGDQATGEAGRPGTRHFRRMAIYVKGGRVIQVREAVDVQGRFLKDVIRYAKTFAKASGATPKQIAEFAASVDAVPEKQRGSLVLEGLSIALSAAGDQPILRRSMTLELTDLGGDIAVDLPTSDVVAGGLGFLVASATGKPEDEGATSGDRGTGAPPGSDTVTEGGAAGDPDGSSSGSTGTSAPAPSP